MTSIAVGCRSLCRTLLLAVVPLAGAACIAWRGDLARLEPEDFSAPAQKRALTFDAVYKANGDPDDKRSKECAEVVAEALQDTGVFASVAATTQKGELHVAFTFDETFNEGAVFATSFLCGFTFGLFPAIANANTSVEAVVYEGGVHRCTVRVDDDLHFVMQILLVPATPFFWPPRVGKKLMTNLVYHVVHDPSLGLAGTPQPGL